MRTLAFLLAVVLLAGCSLGGDDEGGSVEPEQLQKLVLQPADIPRVFVSFDEGRQGSADQPGKRADMTRFGRKGGWKARYRRPGTTATIGPLVIASKADVFGSADGAKDEYEELRRDFREGELKWLPVDAPQVGDAAFALSLVQGTGPAGIRFFLVAWREDNVVASLEVNGFAGKVDGEDAVALARKQARRISTAAAS